MSTSFSTITPLKTSTISKMPAFTVDNQPQAQQPAASNPLDAYSAPKKKSHWFRNTVIGLAVLTAATAILRGKVDMFKGFDNAAELAKDAKFMDKAAHYGKKGVAIVGDFINKYAKMAYTWGAERLAKFKGSSSSGSTAAGTGTAALAP